MQQRELTDNNGTRWTCVQAYGGPGSEGKETDESLAKDDNNKVTVVCTPSGGAKSVRLKLDRSWLDDTSDEKLLQEISNASKTR